MGCIHVIRSAMGRTLGLALVLTLPTASSWAAPPPAVGTLARADFPCTSGSTSPCGGLLRSCSTIVPDTLKKLDDTVVQKIFGLYEQKSSPLSGDGPVKDMKFPTCDVLAGETEQCNASSTRDGVRKECGLPIYVKISMDTGLSGASADPKAYCPYPVQCVGGTTYEGKERGIREMAWIMGMKARGWKCALADVKREVNQGTLRLISPVSADMANEVKENYQGLVATLRTGEEYQSLCAHTDAEVSGCGTNQQVSGENLEIDLDLRTRQKGCYATAYRQGVESRLGFLLLYEVQARAQNFFDVEVTSLMGDAEGLYTRAENYGRSRCESQASHCEDDHCGTFGCDDGDLGRCVTREVNECMPAVMEEFIRQEFETVIRNYFSSNDCPMPVPSPGSGPAPGTGASSSQPPAGIAWASLGLGIPLLPRSRRRRILKVAVPLFLAVAFSNCCDSCGPPGILGLPEDAPLDVETGDDGPPLVVEDEEVGQINEDTSGLAGGLQTSPTPTASTSNESGGSGSAATAGGAGPGGGSSPGSSGAGGVGIPQVATPETGGGGGGGGGGSSGGGGGGFGSMATKAAGAPATGGAFDTSLEEAAYEGGGGGKGKEGGGGGNPFGALFGGGSKDGGAGGGDGALDFAGLSAEDAMLGDDPDDYFARTNPNANLFTIVHQRYEKKQAGWVLTDTRGALSEGAELLKKAKAGAAPAKQ